MNIGILTFHASHNYGSMLQAYALQRMLSKLGQKSEIINFRSEKQKNLILPELEWHHPKSAFKKLLLHPITTFTLQRKYNRFERFLRLYLHCSQELHTQQEVRDYIQNTEICTCIVGSDQIWNTYCMDFDNSYLLDFDLPIKRIAYAPSLGSNPESLPEEKKTFLSNNWSRFDYLSTREVRSSDFVSKLTGRECKTVLDPTLLLTKEDYEKLLLRKTEVMKEPYIFYYTPREEPGTFHVAQELAKVLNYKIIVSQLHQEYSGKNVIHLNDCGPIEFLNIVSHATYTIGNSFHLLAFSILFHRQFLMLSSQRDSRMLNILEPLGLSNRLITPGISLKIPSDIDFQPVDCMIASLRDKSIDYLKKTLL